MATPIILACIFFYIAFCYGSLAFIFSLKCYLLILGALMFKYIVIDYAVEAMLNTYYRNKK